MGPADRCVLVETAYKRIRFRWKSFLGGRAKVGRDQRFERRDIRSVVDPRNSMVNFKKTEPPFSMLAWNTKRETATRSGSALPILFWIYVSRPIRLGRFVYIFLFAAVPRPRSRTPLTGKCDLASALNIFISMQKIIGEYISSVAVVPMNKLCRRVCCHFHKSWRPIGHPLSLRVILA